VLLAADLTASAFLRTDINLVQWMADVAGFHRQPVGGECGCGCVVVGLAVGVCSLSPYVSSADSSSTFCCSCAWLTTRTAPLLLLRQLTDLRMCLFAGHVGCCCQKQVVVEEVVVVPVEAVGVDAPCLRSGSLMWRG
jgi:hypothetical protein